MAVGSDTARFGSVRSRTYRVPGIRAGRRSRPGSPLQPGEVHAALLPSHCFNDLLQVPTLDLSWVLVPEPGSSFLHSSPGRRMGEAPHLPSAPQHAPPAALPSLDTPVYSAPGHASPLHCILH